MVAGAWNSSVAPLVSTHTDNWFVGLSPEGGLGICGGWAVAIIPTESTTKSIEAGLFIIDWTGLLPKYSRAEQLTRDIRNRNGGMVLIYCVSEPEKKSLSVLGFIIRAGVVCVLGGFLLVVVIGNLFTCSCTSPANSCINSLFQIDAAAQFFALEKGKTNGEAINYYTGFIISRIGWSVRGT